jgi:hypothetical protein
MVLGLFLTELPAGLGDPERILGSFAITLMGLDRTRSRARDVQVETWRKRRCPKGYRARSETRMVLGLFLTELPTGLGDPERILGSFA